MRKHDIILIIIMFLSIVVGSAYAADSPKIVCIGDSITWGQAFSPITYPQYLQAKITGSTVINVGINGDVTANMVSRFDSDVLLNDPDYVLIMGGTNDLASFGHENLVKGDLKRMYEKTAAYGAIPVPCTITPRAGFDVPRNAAMARVNLWIKAYAAQHGYPCIDFHAAIEDPSHPTWIMPGCYYDEVHPNQAGFQRMVNSIDSNIFTNGYIPPYYNEYMTYTQSHTIAGANNHVNYLHEMNIYSGVGASSGSVWYLNNHASGFPRDLRFYDSLGNPMYWFAEKTNTTYAKVLIKIPLLPSKGETITVRYGNASAQSISDITYIADFSDDFTATALDLSKWSNTASTTLNVNAAELGTGGANIGSGGADSKLTTKYLTPTNVDIQMKYRMSAYFPYAWMRSTHGMVNDSTHLCQYMSYWDTVGVVATEETINGVESSAINSGRRGSVMPDDYRIYEIDKLVAGSVNYRLDGEYVYDAPAANNPQKAMRGVWDVNASCIYPMDWVFFNRYYPQVSNLAYTPEVAIATTATAVNNTIVKVPINTTVSFSYPMGPGDVGHIYLNGQEIKTFSQSTDYTISKTGLSNITISIVSQSGAHGPVYTYYYMVDRPLANLSNSIKRVDMPVQYEKAVDDVVTFNVTGALGDIDLTMTSKIGSVFYAIIFALPFLFMWINTRRLEMPTVIFLLFGWLFIGLIPAEYHYTIWIAIVVSFAMPFMKYIYRE